MSPHTHGGTDAPECTTCAEVYTARHRGQPRRCKVCGRPEDNHPVRHPFRHSAYHSLTTGVRA